MNEADPHIHVDVDLHADVTARHLLTSTFGLVGNLPSHASTGCGIRVPFAMTSTRPDNVTCLACREYAQRRYLELAAYVEQVSHLPGTSRDITERAARAREEYLDIARRFADPQP